MQRALLLAAACLAGLAAAPLARAHHWPAGACGLPAAAPLYVEYSEVAVSRLVRDGVFGSAHPPLVLATSGVKVAAELRALGAYTIYWQMKIQRMLGNTIAPADPATIDEPADRLYDRAVQTTLCTQPLIALNELQGNWLPTPWSPTYAQYRANTLELLRRLHAHGAHPYLMVTTTPRPFTDSPEAAAWWLEAAEVSDIVLQVHFDGRYVYTRGPVMANRRRRMTMRRVLGQFAAIGIPPVRLGLLHGFQSGHGSGGREGLPLPKWLRVVKWEALAAKQVVAERAQDGIQIGSDWSWGWGDYPLLSPTSTDPDKPVIACVYLWSRDPRLCDGPARAVAAATRYNLSLTEGQIAADPAIQCTVGSPAGVIPTATVARFAAVRGGESLAPVGEKRAIAALFGRLVETRFAGVTSGEVRTAEERVVTWVFDGSRAAYEAELARRGMDLAIARHILADELRARKLERRLRGRYPRWAQALRAKALATTICRRDELPDVRVGDLAPYLSFLRLPH